MPELFKLLARNCILGIAAGWTTLALLIVSNTAHIGDLIYSAADPVLPVAVLAVGFAITFGSVSMGVAVMTLPYDKDAGKGRGLGVFSLSAMFRAWRAHGRSDETMIPIRIDDGQRRQPSRR
jgi:hypothetical protein